MCPFAYLFSYSLLETLMPCLLQHCILIFRLHCITQFIIRLLNIYVDLNTPLQISTQLSFYVFSCCFRTLGSPSPLACTNFTHAVMPLTRKCGNSSTILTFLKYYICFRPGLLPFHLHVLFNTVKRTFKLLGYVVDNAEKFCFNTYIS
jgi:hypothetical protein